MFYFELVSSVVQINYYVPVYLPLINELLKYSLPREAVAPLKVFKTWLIKPQSSLVCM